MLPSASTGPYVFTKLQGGADLMLPGVILPKSEVPDLTGVEKGQLCSISLVGNRYMQQYSFILISLIHVYSVAIYYWIRRD